GERSLSRRQEQFRKKKKKFLRHQARVWPISHVRGQESGIQYGATGWRSASGLRAHSLQPEESHHVFLLAQLAPTELQPASATSSAGTPPREFTTGIPAAGGVRANGAAERPPGGNAMGGRTGSGRYRRCCRDKQPCLSRCAVDKRRCFSIRMGWRQPGRAELQCLDGGVGSP